MRTRKIKIDGLPRAAPNELGAKAYGRALKQYVRLLKKALPRLTVGIVTALPREADAVRSKLESCEPLYRIDDFHTYYLGDVRSRLSNSVIHQVAVVKCIDMGNSSASTATTALMNTFPAIRHVIMCGIAGGVPSPKNPDDHVRLGDVVVSDKRGVVEYDQIKDSSGRLEYRNADPKPSAELIRAASMVRDTHYEWHLLIPLADFGGKKRLRPSDGTDLLYVDRKGTRTIEHPRQHQRVVDRPLLHFGNIGSANILLKNTKRRELLRLKFALKAVEMEGSGVAKAAWSMGRGYLIVRGICDYANEHKNGKWQPYAAEAAAAFTQSVIAHLIDERT